MLDRFELWLCMLEFGRGWKKFKGCRGDCWQSASETASLSFPWSVFHSRVIKSVEIMLTYDCMWHYANHIYNYFINTSTEFSAVQSPGFSPPAPAPAKKSPAPASGKITPARQKISSPGKFVKIRNWMEISFYISKWKHSLSFRCYCRCPKEFAAQSMYCRSFAGVEQTPAPARLRQNRPKLRLRHSGSGAQH